jgi:hypothetical protein
MRTFIVIYSLLLTGIGYGQELVNFYVEPSTMSNVVTLHTSVYRSSVSFFGSFSVNEFNNEINVDLCYINNVVASSIFDQQNFNINLPIGFNSYTLNVQIYSDNDGVSPCTQVNLIDTGSLNFEYPYNPVEKINIPDNVFEDYLEDRSFGDDIVNNDLVYTHRIENMTHLLLDDQFLPLSGDIQDMTGIENFQMLKDLRCKDNLIPELDLSSNVLLERLLCDDNPLTQLDVTSNLNLLLLRSDNTLLTTLDLTNNINLQDLSCKNNMLPTIDVSQNVNLLSLNCGLNQLDNLNLQNNILLEILSFSGNQLSSIDLSNNINLKDITFSNNNFITMDFSNSVLLEKIRGRNNELNSVNLTNLTNLKELDFIENQLVTLDLSANSMLETVALLSNNLSTLNLKNGNNENITVLITVGNQNLFCIDVDDPSQAPYPGWLVLPQTIFSEDCSLGVDDQVATQIAIFPNPVTDSLFIASGGITIEKITVYSLSGQTVLTSENITHSIDVSNLSTGLYFIEISSLKGSYTKRFIKQ